jgi:hypothetical protein
MNHLYISLLALFCCFYTHQVEAIIYLLDILKSPSGQYIFLYSDYHTEEQKEDDKLQFDAFNNLLAQRAANNENIHIFLENPPATIHYLIQSPSILSHCLATCNGKWPSITLEDIEIRQDAVALHVICSPKEDPHTIPDKAKCEARRGLLFMKSLTFEDIDKEMFKIIDDLKAHKTYKDSELIKGFTDWTIAWYVEPAYKNFLEILKRNDISSKDSVLMCVRILFDKEKNNEEAAVGARASLHSLSVHDIFTPLFDANLLQRIIAQETADTILVLAGGRHTFEVKHMLLRYGYTHVATYGKECDDNPIALTSKKLNPRVPHLQNMWNMCPLV